MRSFEHLSEGSHAVLATRLYDRLRRIGRHRAMTQAISDEHEATAGLLLYEPGIATGMLAWLWQAHDADIKGL
jgi:hypothetical protein